MKVALYQPWIYLHGGLEKSILEVVRRSRHDWTLYTGRYEQKNTFPEFADFDVRVLNPTSIKRTIGATICSSWQVIRQRIPLGDAQALVIWCDGIGDLATFRNASVPIVTVCCTPLRAAFDPVYQRLALKNKSLIYRLSFLAFKQLFRFVDRLAWKRYTGIVTISTEVRNRIIDGGLCTDPTKMLMAYPGIEWSEDPGRVEYQPYVLLGGRIMWTKNIQQGINAFAAARLPAPWKLVIAGFVDAKSRPYLEELKQLVPEGVEVEFVVAPSDAELDRLNRNASFALFTALNEDWGIAPIEAMNRCKAVIANASGGPLESIVGGRTGFLFEPEDTAGWAGAIRKLALDPELCRKMGSAAHDDVKRFSWNRFVEVIDDGIEQWVIGTVGERATAAVAEAKPLMDMADGLVVATTAAVVTASVAATTAASEAVEQIQTTSENLLS